MFSEFNSLAQMLQRWIGEFSQAGYMLGTVVLIIVVGINLGTSRWLWVLMAGLCAKFMVQGIYLYINVRFRSGGGMFPEYQALLPLSQIVGWGAQSLDVLGISGFIFSYRAQQRALRQMEYMSSHAEE